MNYTVELQTIRSHLSQLTERAEHLQETIEQDMINSDSNQVVSTLGSINAELNRMTSDLEDAELNLCDAELQNQKLMEV